MKNPNYLIILQKVQCFCGCLFLLLFLISPAFGDWLKTTNPPDVDKAEHDDIGKGTCWLAAAANMLAGAGYGDGDTIQERADDIYTQLKDLKGTGCGWADIALRDWLDSEYNTWKNTNPYKYVHLYGEANCKSNRVPWSNPNAAMFIGNELRHEHCVRLSIHRPYGICHAITAWGDDGGGDFLTENPEAVQVTDSDYNDPDQDVQVYVYDAYDHPNPGGTNWGHGWYINYNYQSTTHPYIDNVVTLSSMPGWVDLAGAEIGYTRVMKSSYRIHQDNETLDATDLHYKASSKTTYGYRTTINWDTENSPVIIEDDNPPTELTVAWDLSDNPVPYCTDITITTEMNVSIDPGTGVIPPVGYENVRFTYPFEGLAKPSFGWQLTTNTLTSPADSNETGGYVVGAFDLYADAGGAPGGVVGHYRLVYEYHHTENPEEHFFELIAPAQTYWVGDFKFGHSYSLPDDDELWQFDEWWYYEPMPEPLWAPLMPIVVDFSGRGLLPYPKAQDVSFRPPEKCGDPGTVYAGGDINKDCKVDLEDFCSFAASWLSSTDPAQE